MTTGGLITMILSVGAATTLFVACIVLVIRAMERDKSQPVDEGSDENFETDDGSVAKVPGNDEKRGA